MDPIARLTTATNPSVEKGKVRQMAALIAQASCDERGRYMGGQAGNQSGTELNFRNYYSDPNNRWTALRFKDVARADRVAKEVTAAVNNRHVGYDQGQRNDIMFACERAGWSMEAINEDTEGDCTTLGATGSICAGASKDVLYAGGNLPYSGNFVAKMMQTGMFDNMGTLPEGELCTGDVLIRSGHCVIVVSGKPRTDGTSSAPPTADASSIEEVARAVVMGKYGVQPERQKAIEALGIDYEAVRTRVNELLRGTPNAPGTSTGSARIIAGRYKVIATNLNVRDAPSLSAKKVASYAFGEHINTIAADIVEADGYVWAHYSRQGGGVGYVALGTSNGSEKYLAKA